MVRRRFAFLLLLLIPLHASASAVVGEPSYRDHLVQQALKLKLDQDPYWRVLLHYRTHWLSGLKSDIKSRAFFNAPDGRTDPRSELIATIAKFFEPSKRGEQPPQCRFIDRYRWLKLKLGFDSRALPEQPCQEYKQWRAAVDPSSVTLVFSSYFMSNPSSAFGHTLLRLNHRGPAGDEKLLDYGVNYAADPTTKNALFYGVLGLVGGFSGTFSNIPYFMKVEQYNNVESRELWEYDLRFSREQLDRLMLHLWVVGHITTPYYFLDQNCSYMILTLLDAANPDLGLADEFASSGWVIPADTLRAVVRIPGFVEKVSVRPSLVDRINRQRARLTPEENALFLALISHPGSSVILNGIRTRRGGARILDLTADYLRYLKVEHQNVLSAGDSRLQSNILLARSELSDPPQDVSFSPNEIKNSRPDAGHDTSRIALASGTDAVEGSFVELGVRPAFHDLNASNLGYPEGAQIEALDVNVRYSPRPGLLRLDRVTLIDILSVNPWDQVFKRLSWSARLGADPVRDFDCNDCLEYRGEVGAGLSLKIAEALRAYALGKAEVGFGAAYVPGYRLGPAAEMGALAKFSNDLSLRLGATYHHPLMGYTPAYLEGFAEARYSLSRDSELRLGYSAYPTTTDEKVGLNVYF